jgi:hypothetical protein
VSILLIRFVRSWAVYIETKVLCRWKEDAGGMRVGGGMLGENRLVCTAVAEHIRLVVWGASGAWGGMPAPTTLATTHDLLAPEFKMRGPKSTSSSVYTFNTARLAQTTQLKHFPESLGSPNRVFLGPSFLRRTRSDQSFHPWSPCTVPWACWGRVLI